MLQFRVLYQWTHQLFSLLFIAPLVDFADLSVHVAFDHKVVFTAIQSENLLGDLYDDD